MALGVIHIEVTLVAELTPCCIGCTNTCDDMYCLSDDGLEDLESNMITNLERYDHITAA